MMPDRNKLLKILLLAVFILVAAWIIFEFIFNRSSVEFILKNNTSENATFSLATNPSQRDQSKPFFSQNLKAGEQVTLSIRIRKADVRALLESKHNESFVLFEPKKFSGEQAVLTLEPQKQIDKTALSTNECSTAQVTFSCSSSSPITQIKKIPGLTTTPPPSSNYGGTNAIYGQGVLSLVSFEPEFKLAYLEKDKPLSKQKVYDLSVEIENFSSTKLYTAPESKTFMLTLGNKKAYIFNGLGTKPEVVNASQMWPDKGTQATFGLVGFDGKSLVSFRGSSSTTPDDDSPMDASMKRYDYKNKRITELKIPKQTRADKVWIMGNKVLLGGFSNVSILEINGESTEIIGEIGEAISLDKKGDKIIYAASGEIYSLDINSYTSETKIGSQLLAREPNLSISRVTGASDEILFSGYLKKDQFNKRDLWEINVNKTASFPRLESIMPYGKNTLNFVNEMEYIDNKMNISLALESISSGTGSGKLSYDKSEKQRKIQILKGKMVRDGVNPSDYELVFRP